MCSMLEVPPKGELDSGLLLVLFLFIKICFLKLLERMGEMEAESMAKLVELEQELCAVQRQRHELENAHTEVTF